MLDKNLLQDWREYQKQKKRIKMAEKEGFSCVFEGLDYILRFKHKEEEIILQRNGRRGLALVIPRDKINGYTPADEPGLTLDITFVEEAEESPIRLYFHDRMTLMVTLSLLEHFLRERVDLPTPSSSESDFNK